MGSGDVFGDDEGGAVGGVRGVGEATEGDESGSGGLDVVVDGGVVGDGLPPGVGVGEAAVAVGGDGCGASVGDESVSVADPGEGSAWVGVA